MTKCAASIVIPTYNRAKLLRRAIETAIAQTIKCDVIVCDHGSSDNTSEIVAAYKDKVRYVRRDKDSGPFFSWLDGVQNAEAEFVHLTYDDDWIDVSFIEKCLRLFSSDCAFCFTSALVHYDNRPAEPCFNDFFETGVHASEKIEDFLLGFELSISPGCAVFRTHEAVKAIMTAALPLGKYSYHGVGADLLLFLVPLMFYERFAYVNERLAHFLSHEQSITIDALREERKAVQIKNAYDDAKRIYLVLKDAHKKDLGTQMLARWKERKALGKRMARLRTGIGRIRKSLVRFGS